MSGGLRTVRVFIGLLVIGRESYAGRRRDQVNFYFRNGCVDGDGGARVGRKPLRKASSPRLYLSTIVPSFYSVPGLRFCGDLRLFEPSVGRGQRK